MVREKEVNKIRGKVFFLKFIIIFCLGNNVKRNVFKINFKKSKLLFFVVDCFFYIKKNKVLDNMMFCFYWFMLSQGRG